MKIFAETERLILREVLPKDEEGFFELDSNPEVHKYLGNKPITNIEQARDAIAFIRQQYIDNGIGRWAIIEKETNEFIGWAGLKLVKESINEHKNFYDVGYRLIKRKWGNGFATEATVSSLLYGFSKLKLTKIYAMADIANTSSNKIIRKSGFVFVNEFIIQSVNHNWYEIDHVTFANRT